MTNDNGGTALESAWTLTAAGPTGFSGAGPSVSSGASFDAGTYALSESGPAGYTASAWVCVGGTQGDASITLGLGQSATCTITNNDNAPSLTLVKTVTNDNGGTAAESDWTLTAAGPTGFSGAGPAVSNGASFDAGTYTLSESGPAGYTAGAWMLRRRHPERRLDRPWPGRECHLHDHQQRQRAQPDPGQDRDQRQRRHRTGKRLDSDRDRPDSISGAGPTVLSDASFDAGTYDLSESGPGGYTASAWSCVGGTQDEATLSPWAWARAPPARSPTMTTRPA